MTCNSILSILVGCESSQMSDTVMCSDLGYWSRSISVLEHEYMDFWYFNNMPMMRYLMFLLCHWTYTFYMKFSIFIAINSHLVASVISIMNKMTSILADGIFLSILMFNENICIVNPTSLKFVPKGPMNSQSALLKKCLGNKHCIVVNLMLPCEKVYTGTICMMLWLNNTYIMHVQKLFLDLYWFHDEDNYFYALKKYFIICLSLLSLSPLTLNIFVTH